MGDLTVHGCKPALGRLHVNSKNCEPSRRWQLDNASQSSCLAEDTGVLLKDTASDLSWGVCNGWRSLWARLLQLLVSEPFMPMVRSFRRFNAERRRTRTWLAAVASTRVKFWLVFTLPYNHCVWSHMQFFGVGYQQFNRLAYNSHASIAPREAWSLLP